MTSTPVSLLNRLKEAPPDSEDWRKLQDLYAPLIRGWLGRMDRVGDEASDITQEILLVVFREIGEFQRGGRGAFRAWLRQITVNKLRAFWKLRRRTPRHLDSKSEEDLLLQLEDPASRLSREWDDEHDRHILSQLIKQIRPDVSEVAWSAFEMFAIQGIPARQVASILEITENSVLLHKSRILKRLRREAAGLVDENAEES